MRIETVQAWLASRRRQTPQLVLDVRTPGDRHLARYCVAYLDDEIVNGCIRADEANGVVLVKGPERGDSPILRYGRVVIAAQEPR